MNQKTISCFRCVGGTKS